MCTILFAYKKHPAYELIVAANRDEFYNRPTAPAHYWEDQPNILAGRDLEKMGTWMGVTTSGQFSALTNYRDPMEQQDGRLSRGSLVTDMLINQTNPKNEIQTLIQKGNLFPGFNLLAGNIKDLYHYSNRTNNIQKITRGIYGLSNHLLDTEWPKVSMGKEQLAKIVTENNDTMIDDLLTLMQNKEPFPDNLLPETGMSIEWERKLSSLFIESETYGTRSSTVILMGTKEIHFVERVFSKNGMKDQSYTIKMEV